jgi:hypothetical protein
MSSKMLVVTAVLAASVVGRVNAQTMPFFDINGLAQQNIAFGQYMDQRAWQQAWDIARQLPPGYQVPFNMSAWQQSMQGYNQAAANYLQGMQTNSQRTSAAINHWGQAFRGNALYTPTYGGPGYYLPWTSPSYNVGPSGMATPGMRWDTGTNVFAY